MNIFKKYFVTSVGRKFLVAITSVGLIFFLIAHLMGNLLFFAGQNEMNEYAVTLRSFPKLLWFARISLLFIFVTHFGLALILRLENKKARPISYSYNNTVQASIASRNMALTGLAMLSYIIYHLMHYTWGIVHNQFFNFKDASGRHDVYSMVYYSFKEAPIVIAYFLALLFTLLHLSHGIPSLFQSVGLLNRVYVKQVNFVGKAFALILFIGYMSIPVAIYFSLIKFPPILNN